MRSERPLLTIAVPTFNRSRYLSLLLSSLIAQLKQETRIELIVSDNASTDDTETAVRRSMSEGASIRYLRNEVNIGADRNFLQCFEKAEGTYVWIIGDDDVVEPYGLKKVMSALASPEEYDLIYLRGRGFDGTYKPPLKEPHDKHIVFTRAEDFASHVHVYVSFISGIIVNKDRVLAVPHRPFSDLTGTALMQLGWVYTALEHHRRSLAIENPIVAALINNSGGYSLARVFGANLGGITQAWLTSDSVKGRIIRGTLQCYFPHYLAHLPGKGESYIKDDPDRVLRPIFGRYFHYWIFVYPVVRLRPPLNKIWSWIVRVISKADKCLGRPLLSVSVFDRLSYRKGHPESTDGEKTAGRCEVDRCGGQAGPPDCVAQQGADSANNDSLRLTGHRCVY